MYVIGLIDLTTSVCCTTFFMFCVLSIIALAEGRLERYGSQGDDEQQQGGWVIAQHCRGARFRKEMGGALINLN